MDESKQDSRRPQIGTALDLGYYGQLNGLVLALVE